MAKKNVLKSSIKDRKKDKVVLTKTFSNRRESINWENSTNDSINQWDEVKVIYSEKIHKENVENELKKREEKVKIEKQKIFISEIKKEKEKEEESLLKRIEIDEKIRTKKRREIKKRDIAFRNRNIYG